MKSPIVKFIVKLLISAAFIYLVLARVDFREFQSSLLRVQPERLLVVFGLVLLFLLPKIYKWYILARQTDEGVTFKDATLSYLAGLVLGVITPARTGELARVMYLKMNDRLKGAGLVVIDRLFDIWVVLLFAILGSFAFLHYTFSIGLIAICVCLILALYLARPLAGAMHAVVRILPFKRKLESVVDASNACTKSTMTIVMLCTLASYFVFCVQAYYFVRCFEEIRFLDALRSFPMIALINVLPITIGGIGLRENAAILILGKYSISPGVAASVSFILFFVDIVIPGIIGLSIWTFLKRASSQRA